MREGMNNISASEEIIGRADAPVAIYIGEPAGPTVTMTAVRDSFPVTDTLILLLLILIIVFLVLWIRGHKKK